MPLRPRSDLSPADWLADASDPPDQLITRGPSGFEAYARILHAWLDGDHHERREGCLEPSQLAAVCAIGSGHTTSADHCFNALWDGFGDIDGGEAVDFLTSFAGSTPYSRLFRQSRRRTPPPAFPPAVLDGPRLRLAHRDYLLFEGPLADAGRWGAVPYDVDIPRDINSPNLLWPADHAWFLATEVDQSWTGIAGSRALVAALLADDRLETVRSGEPS